MTRNAIQTSKSDRILDIVFYIILTALLIVCAYPVYYVVIASVSDPNYVNSGAFLVFPVGFRLDGYTYILNDAKLWMSYKNTIIYVVGGTLLGLACTLPAGYAFSREDMPGRKPLMKVYIFTMYFSGGLIPTYILIKDIGLLDTPWILIILGSVSVYNIILVRTFFVSNLPHELQEAAFIEGCGNFRFLFSFAIPLSKPIIAVIGMYIAVGYWNSYFNAMIYTRTISLMPLQLYLQQLLMVDMSVVNTAGAEQRMELYKILRVMKFSVIVVSTLPIMCIYPFLQKYFVQGVMLGSVKG